MQSINGAQWMVADQIVVVPGNVKVEGEVAVGKTVEIEAFPEGDHLKATKVKVP